MSKVGRAALTIPDSVTLQVEGSVVTVKGSKGEMTHTLPRTINAKLDGSTLTLTRKNEAKPTRALHGLSRALIANMVEGVSVGFKKSLELVGTGYRARLQGSKLILSLGFSHEVEYEPLPGVTLQVEGTNLIHVAGFNKASVGQVAAVIRDYKRPEPYKGKGIRYVGEVVRRKAGKAGKGASA